MATVNPSNYAQILRLLSLCLHYLITYADFINNYDGNEIQPISSENLSQDSESQTINMQNPNNPNGRSDIVQLWESENGGVESPENAMRNALKPTARNKWTRYRDSNGNFVIPYIISGSFSSSELKIIDGAMKSIAKSTCMRYVKRKSESDYIDIQNKRGEGCYAVVGRVPGRSVVMLESSRFSTCVLHETVLHELMHTIGLWHEQMRYDRDQYIRIHYENISPSSYPQFRKVPKSESTTYGVKYDYRSVMHYAKDAFATIPGKITMETKDPKAQNIIGNVKHGSPGDYTKICSIYKCSRCMGRKFKGTNGKSTSTDSSRKSGKRRHHHRRKGGKRHRKHRRRHHGGKRKHEKHKDRPKISSSLSNLLDNLENMFNLKPATTPINSDDTGEVRENTSDEHTSGSEQASESQESNASEKESDEDENNESNPFEKDFLDILQNDDEIDVEHDEWAHNWLDIIHRDFPDLTDTWDLGSIQENEESSETEQSNNGIFSIFHFR